MNAVALCAGALAACLLAMPAARAQPSVGVQVVEALNAGRQAVGVGPFGIDPRLQAAAEWHAHDMALNGCFQHAACDGTPPLTWLADFYPGVALDFIGRGFTTPQSFVDALLADPQHRQYLVDPGFLGAGAAFEGGDWSLAIGRLAPPVPEPATALLALLGIAGLALHLRKTHQENLA
jgi:uncharacterized protein YkwD